MKASSYLIVICELIMIHSASCIRNNVIISENKIENEFHSFPCKAEPVNISAIRDSVGRSAEVKLLQKAGIECGVVVKVTIDSLGNYLSHSYIEKCHPLAVKAVDAYIGELFFVFNDSIAVPSKCDVITYFSWKTW